MDAMEFYQSKQKDIDTTSVEQGRSVVETSKATRKQAIKACNEGQSGPRVLLQKTLTELPADEHKIKWGKTKRHTRNNLGTQFQASPQVKTIPKVKLPKEKKTSRQNGKYKRPPSSIH